MSSSSSTQLPSPADLEEALTPGELSVLQQQYDKEEEAGHLSTQAMFNLAWGLVKCQGSQSKPQINAGVKLFGQIYNQEPKRRRECLYYLALGHYKLGNFDEARRFNNMLMDKEPTNLQAQALSDLIEKDVSKDGLIGLALVGSIAAVAGTIVFGLLSRKR